jgi:peptidoglycan L-alanyl-D-glutamate endopeptidase CwlK
MYNLSNRSRGILATVKEPLRRVVTRAIQLTKVDFAVVQGGRTLDVQRRLYGKGRTAAQCARMGVPVAYAQPHEAKVTWIDPRKGNHVVDATGLGSAVDLAPYVHGKLEWDDNGKLGLWPQIAAAMKEAAAIEHVSIRWGGDWEGTPDRPHFELAR